MKFGLFPSICKGSKKFVSYMKGNAYWNLQMEHGFFSLVYMHVLILLGILCNELGNNDTSQEIYIYLQTIEFLCLCPLYT